MKLEDLKQIAHELKIQDNRITQDPLFCVFEKQVVTGGDPDYQDDVNFSNDDDGNEYKWFEIDKFVNAHFTEKAARKFIDENRHNLRKPFVYVTSMFRCPEMIKIRNLLMDELVLDDTR